MPRGDTGGGGGEGNRGELNNMRRAAERRRKEDAARPKAKTYDKTKGFKYSGKRKKSDPYRAGANILDKKGKVAKRATFDEHLKSTGNRADDPRNWEFHYKAPTRTGNYLQGKNDNRRNYETDAQNRAKSKAKRTGKEVYEVQKIEYSTQGIIQGTEEAGAKAKAKGGAGAFGSTRVAKGVAAQKQRGQRRTGRATARTATAGAIA